MPGLGAEMRHIDHCSRIIRPQAHTIARIQWAQPLAQFQNRQGAQKPGGIEIFNLHRPEINQMLHPVHSVVTGWGVTAGARAGGCGPGLEVI